MNDKNISKIKLKRVSGQTHRVDTNSRSIQEDSAIIQNHLATPNSQIKQKKIKAYTIVLSEPAYIHDYSRTT